MKQLIKLVLMAAFVFSLAGCNTVEGIGKDMQEGGKALTKSAQKNA